MMRDCVVIIGSGLMGSGIACKSVLAGNPTILVDTTLARAQAGVEQAQRCIHELYVNGLAGEQAAEQAKCLLTCSDDLRKALEQARFVIEAVYENLELKQELFREIDEQLPKEVPVASNTSGLRITDIAAKTRHPERTMTTHFWFPAHLVPLVEVVMSEFTNEETALAVKRELAVWGKAPVLVRRDLPGQLANRILQAVIR